MSNLQSYVKTEQAIPMHAMTLFDEKALIL